MGTDARGCSMEEDRESFWRSVAWERACLPRCLHEPSPQAMIMVGSVLMQSIVAVHGVSGRGGSSPARQNAVALPLRAPRAADPTERNMSRPEALSRKSGKLPTFFVGKNSRRRWVVRDQRGLCQALFVKRAEAIRFAIYASGGRSRAVTMVPGVFELNVKEAEGTRIGRPRGRAGA
jgi:hypothetical protein